MTVALAASRVQGLEGRIAIGVHTKVCHPKSCAACLPNPFSRHDSIGSACGRNCNHVNTRQH